MWTGCPSGGRTGHCILVLPSDEVHIYDYTLFNVTVYYIHHKNLHNNLLSFLSMLMIPLSFDYSYYQDRAVDFVLVDSDNVTSTKLYKVKRICLTLISVILTQHSVDYVRAGAA